MFGCTDLWIGKRFEPALTAFLNGERERRELRAQEAIDAGAVDRLYDAWRAECGGAPRAWWDESAVPGDAFSGWDSTAAHVPLGRTHVVPSNRDTVALGVFDPKREPVTTVDSGDVVVYRDTWTHFLNRLQPGVTIDELAAMRAECRGRGVHSIVGPVAVRGAMPGDVVQLRTLRLETIDFGANFHNPRSIGTGALPDDFEHGHIEYFSLDAERGFVEFDPRIRLTLRPFQGTLGLAAAGDEAISSVAPHRHAGNIDLKDLTVGSSLFVPVAHAGGLIFTGDSHALQGDGEVNITALETAMREAAIQVILHENAPWTWPFAETATHWIALGFDPNLNEALRIALRNTIDFLTLRAGLSRDRAYSLASLGVDFRVTQMVDVNNGVHAMIPKSIFAPDFRREIRIA
ncbi:MAG TPA: acetamidase/formamidase family protein [Candidatus Baltobacteraceae bacterium]|nr:acetamidase/formamidase family protein [Candidatus Baltobacteraceae bacterium]